ARSLEVVQHVRSAVGRPAREEAMVGIGKRSAPTNGHEPRIALLAEDHASCHVAPGSDARSPTPPVSSAVSGQSSAMKIHQRRKLRDTNASSVALIVRIVAEDVHHTAVAEIDVGEALVELQAVGTTRGE